MSKIKDVDRFWKIVLPKVHKLYDLKVLQAWFLHKSSYHPKMSQIADQTGIARPHISRSFTNLVKLNILTRDGFNSNGKNIKQTPTYKIHQNILDEIAGKKIQPEPKLPQIGSGIDKDGEKDWSYTPLDERIDIKPEDLPKRKNDNDFLKTIGVENVYE